MALAHLWVLVWPVNAVQEKQLRVKITTTTIKNEIQKISCKNIPPQLLLGYLKAMLKALAWGTQSDQALDRELAEVSKSLRPVSFEPKIPTYKQVSTKRRRQKKHTSAVGLAVGFGVGCMRV